MVDLVVGFTALGLIALIVLGATAERRSQARQERRAAALDIAQNLLAIARRGDVLPERPGWTCSRTVLPGGVIEVRVHSRELSLSTLLSPAKPTPGAQP